MNISDYCNDGETKPYLDSLKTCSQTGACDPYDLCRDQAEEVIQAKQEMRSGESDDQNKIF